MCPNKSKQLSRNNFSIIPLIPHTLAESKPSCASPLCGIEKTSRTDPAQLGVDPAQMGNNCSIYWGGLTVFARFATKNVLYRLVDKSR